METASCKTDPYDKALVEAVHPPGWENPHPAPCYNLVVLGGGTAGLVSAAIAAGLGARVALVERHLLGGDCLNVGCVPSKGLIRCARMAADVRKAAQFGVMTREEEVDVDFAAAMERMHRLRSGISVHDSAARFRDMGVDVYFGKGRFVAPDQLEVEGQTLRFRKAIIATGTRPRHPDVPGLAQAGFLTNETVFSLTERPERLVVIGGGPIGCELAQAFQRLGSRVTLLHSKDRLLPRDDPEAGQLLERVFAREGIRVIFEARIAGIDGDEAGKQVRVMRKGEAETIGADAILVATGRVPNVEQLGLEAAEVEYDMRAGVWVDDFLRTTNPLIFAAGDICLAHKFTHTADFAARVAVQNALFPFLPKRRFSRLVIPWCTYTDPEVAHAGAAEQELLDRGIAYQTIRVGMEEVDRAVLEGETEGFLKVRVGAKGEILGATLVAAHAGETISELTAAMAGKKRLSDLGNVIHPYPTQAEIIRKAADQHGRGRLTPGRRRALVWLFEKMR